MTTLMVFFVILCVLYVLGAIAMTLFGIKYREIWSIWMAVSVGAIALVALIQAAAKEPCTGLLTPLLLGSIAGALVAALVRGRSA